MKKGRSDGRSRNPPVALLEKVAAVIGVFAEFAK